MKLVKEQINKPKGISWWTIHNRSCIWEQINTEFQNKLQDILFWVHSPIYLELRQEE